MAIMPLTSFSNKNNTQNNVSFQKKETRVESRGDSRRSAAVKAVPLMTLLAMTPNISKGAERGEYASNPKHEIEYLEVPERPSRGSSIEYATAAKIANETQQTKGKVIDSLKYIDESGQNSEVRLVSTDGDDSKFERIEIIKNVGTSTKKYIIKDYIKYKFTIASDDGSISDPFYAFKLGAYEDTPNSNKIAYYEDDEQVFDYINTNWRYNNNSITDKALESTHDFKDETSIGNDIGQDRMKDADPKKKYGEHMMEFYELDGSNGKYIIKAYSNAPSKEQAKQFDVITVTKEGYPELKVIGNYYNKIKLKCSYEPLIFGTTLLEGNGWDDSDVMCEGYVISDPILKNTLSHLYYSGKVNEEAFIDTKAPEYHYDFSGKGNLYKYIHPSIYIKYSYEDEKDIQLQEQLLHIRNKEEAKEELKGK